MSLYRNDLLHNLIAQNYPFPDSVLHNQIIFFKNHNRWSKLPPLKGIGLGVITADQTYRAVARTELQTDGAHIVRTDKQHLPAVQGEKVRTFPHPLLLIAGSVHGSCQNPFFPIPSAIFFGGKIEILRDKNYNKKKNRNRRKTK